VFQNGKEKRCAATVRHFFNIAKSMFLRKRQKDYSMKQAISKTYHHERNLSFYFLQKSAYNDAEKKKTCVQDHR